MTQKKETSPTTPVAQRIVKAMSTLADYHDGSFSFLLGPLGVVKAYQNRIGFTYWSTNSGEKSRKAELLGKLAAWAFKHPEAAETAADKLKTQAARIEAQAEENRTGKPKMRAMKDSHGRRVLVPEEKPDVHQTPPPAQKLPTVGKQSFVNEVFAVMRDIAAIGTKHGGGARLDLLQGIGTLLCYRDTHNDITWVLDGTPATENEAHNAIHAAGHYGFDLEGAAKRLNTQYNELVERKAKASERRVWTHTPLPVGFVAASEQVVFESRAAKVLGDHCTAPDLSKCWDGERGFSDGRYQSDIIRAAWMMWLDKAVSNYKALGEHKPATDALVQQLTEQVKTLSEENARLKAERETLVKPARHGLNAETGAQILESMLPKTLRTQHDSSLSAAEVGTALHHAYEAGPNSVPDYKAVAAQLAGTINLLLNAKE